MTTEQTSTASLNLTYEGPALVQGSMSARDLGPALQAISDLFDRASVLLDMEEVAADVQVTATRSGSFDIALTLELLRVTSVMLGGTPTTTAVNLVQMIMMVVAILKRLKGNRAVLEQSETQILEELTSGSLRLGDLEASWVASDDTTRQILIEAVSIAKDPPALHHIRKVAEPVGREGVERLSIRRSGDIIETIEKADLSSLGPFPGESNQLSVTVLRQWLSVESPNLSARKGRWRFSDGARVNWYSIADQEFVKEVADGTRAFRAGDSLDCEVHQNQRMDSNGKLTMDYQIIKVFSHRSKHETGTQMRF